MQGLVRREDGSVALQELPTPEPGPGQILVRTTLTTICGSDVHFVEDFPPRGRRASQRALGHEGVGVVEQVGDGVIRHSAGDRVVASCVQPCGTCEECLRGNSSLCERLRGGTGCLAEYFIVTNADVAATQIPDDLRDDEVIFAGDIMSTGFGAIENGEVALGDSVAIFAQGPGGALRHGRGAAARGGADHRDRGDPGATRDGGAPGRGHRHRSRRRGRGGGDPAPHGRERGRRGGRSRGPAGDVSHGDLGPAAGGMRVGVRDLRRAGTVAAHPQPVRRPLAFPLAVQPVPARDHPLSHRGTTASTN